MLALFEKIARKREERDPARRQGMRQRVSGIVATFGLCCNLFLAIAKIVAAYLSNSLAMAGDAINNLTDSLASVIGVIGVKLSGRRPDKEHPFGYKRTEYIASTVVAAMILTVAFNLAVSAVDRLRNPETLELSWFVFAPLVVSILLKLYMWQLYRRMSKKYETPLFEATALDSISDVLTTAVTLIALVSSEFSSFPFDAIAGLICAAFIAWQGIKLLRETLNQLLGPKQDETLEAEIGKILKSHPNVIGWHDLIIHNYGPDRNFATCHVEVPGDASLLEMHEVIDYLERKIQLELGVHIVLHLDPRIEFEGEERVLQQGLARIVKAISPELYLHDLRIERDRDHYDLIFDLGVPEKLAMTDDELRLRLGKDLQEWRVDVKAFVTLDHHNISTTEPLDTDPPVVK